MVCECACVVRSCHQLCVPNLMEIYVTTFKVRVKKTGVTSFVVTVCIGMHDVL